MQAHNCTYSTHENISMNSYSCNNYLLNLHECNINVVILRYCRVVWKRCDKHLLADSMSEVNLSEMLWWVIGFGCWLAKTAPFLIHCFFVCYRLGPCALCTCPILSTMEDKKGERVERKSESTGDWGGTAVTPHPLHCTLILSVTPEKKCFFHTQHTYYPHCVTFSCPHGIIKTQGCLCAQVCACTFIKGYVWFCHVFSCLPLDNNSR